MKASELKKIVSLLLPCTAGANAMVPILSHICFTEEGLYAFNDSIATHYLWEHGIGEFAVDGRALNALLSQWGDVEVKIELEESTLHIKCGKAKVKLPVLGAEQFVYAEPEMEKYVQASMKDDEDAVRFTEALDSVAAASVNPVFNMVTLASTEGVLKAYTTNGHTMIHAKIGSVKTSSESSWVIPKLAAQQILALWELDEGGITLRLSKEALIAKNDHGSVTCALPEAEGALGNASLFLSAAKFETEAEIGGWNTDRFQQALNVVSVVKDNFGGKGCVIVVGDGELKLSAKTKNSEITDSAKANTKGNFKFGVDPELMKKVFVFDSLTETKKIIVGERALRIGDPDEFLLVIATQSTAAEE